MINYLKYFAVLLLVTVELSSSVSITGLVDVENSKEPLLFLPHMKNTNLRSEGIFVRFIRNLLDLLTTTFPLNKLPKYCRMLSRHVNELDYKPAKKLAKHLKHMSRMYREDLRDELMLYRQELGRKSKHRVDFLEAMDKAFTLQEHILFDDYVYELKNYGTGDKLFMDDETEKLLNDAILKSVLRLSSKDRYDLQKNLKYAVKEFNFELSEK